MQPLRFETEACNRYKAPRPYFHTFEGDEAQIGLNFADESEALVFRQAVELKLAERRQRREKRQSNKRQQQQQQMPGGGECDALIMGACW